MIASYCFKIGKIFHIVSVGMWRRALYLHRVAAGVEHISILRGIGDVRMVVDIGANRGQFALAARYCFPSACIMSFEPLPAPAAVFRKVFFDDTGVLLFESAIGPQAGEAIIHLSARDDSSSLLPITDLQNKLFPGTVEAGTRKIVVAKLSDVLLKAGVVAPALLKLDVQGFELQTLGACEDILECFAWVYVECSFVELYAGQAFADEVIAWLRERGFRLRGVYHISHDDMGTAIQADFLFSRIDKYMGTCE